MLTNTEPTLSFNGHERSYTFTADLGKLQSITYIDKAILVIKCTNGEIGLELSIDDLCKNLHLKSQAPKEDHFPNKQGSTEYRRE